MPTFRDEAAMLRFLKSADTFQQILRGDLRRFKVLNLMGRRRYLEYASVVVAYSDNGVTYYSRDVANAARDNVQDVVLIFAIVDRLYETEAAQHLRVTRSRQRGFDCCVFNKEYDIVKQLAASRDTDKVITR